jgi:para-aminobenzoate synthetase component II
MVLVIDNFDSFTYNLVHLVGRVTPAIEVRRNDAVTVAEIRSMRPDGILLSPGPGRPEHAGVTVEVVRALSGEIPMLGVCLGHQAIGAAFGAPIAHAPVLMHGRTSEIRHNGEGVFLGLPNPFTATRYHSLMIAPDALPDELEVTARSEEGAIMAIRHRSRPLVGVQFHPESILTVGGEMLIRNWLGVKKST